MESLEKSQVAPFLVKRVDEHIFIKFNAIENHFWSPQLHLEIVETDTITCKLFGVFGPNPTLWTFFMFLHFGVATLFIALGIWAYSSATLHKPYTFQLVLMGFLIFIWFVLYFFGRVGKHKGKPQMQELYHFMLENLKT
ncbi:MAG: GTP-binding protein [Flavobacteriaceae bacterium]